MNQPETANERWILAYLRRDHAGLPLARRRVVVEAAFCRETGHRPAHFAAALDRLTAAGRLRRPKRPRAG